MPPDPFVSMPSGSDIARYFMQDHATDLDGQGCDGIPLWRDGRAYSYVWMEAHIDHDLEQFFLLEVRTAAGQEPFDETRDYLYVAIGVGPSLQCEWFNRPIRFGASHEEHAEHLQAGLTWFIGRVMADNESARES